MCCIYYSKDILQISVNEIVCDVINIDDKKNSLTLPFLK